MLGHQQHDLPRGARDVLADAQGTLWVTSDDTLYHRAEGRFVAHGVRDWLEEGGLLQPAAHPTAGVVLVTATGGAVHHTTGDRTLLSVGSSAAGWSACAVAPDGTLRQRPARWW